MVEYTQTSIVTSREIHLECIIAKIIKFKKQTC